MTLIFLVVLASPAAAGATGIVNGKIVYATDYSGDLYTVNPDGTNNTRITPTGTVEEEPEFSPDGGEIAYTRHPPTRGDDLWVTSADGADVRQLTFQHKPIDSPVWSTDGSRILFLTERDNDFDGAEIYSIAPDGTGETLLADDALGLSSGSTISTAGNRVAFISATGADVVVMNLDGSGRTALAAEPLSSERNPQLSPDGTRVAFESDRGAQEIPRVYTIGADGSALSQLTSERAGLGGWSPDGARIAVTEGLGSVAVLNADGSGRSVISPPTVTDLSAQEFSPDGATVAAAKLLPRCGEDPYYRLFGIPTAGGRALPLTAKRDGAVYGDWQALDAAPGEPEPSLRLTVLTKRSGKPTLTVECSNECDVKLTARGSLGGVEFDSRTRAHLYGADRQDVPALGARSLRLLRGERGRVRVTVKARDDFGQRARTSATVRLVR